jgi:hypothetical protein
MADYYEQIDALQRRLTAAGQPDIAYELEQAVRRGSTSSEILSETGVILGRLLDSGEAERLRLSDEVARIDRLGRETLSVDQSEVVTGSYADRGVY